jgi:HTH-type transcriptional regulator/antitoxin HipB
MTQADLAKAMGRHQPFIANIENGDRRVDVVELIDLAKIIGFDVHDIIDELAAAKS